jgi:hypothetical protein
LCVHHRPAVYGGGILNILLAITFWGGWSGTFEVLLFATVLATGGGTVWIVYHTRGAALHPPSADRSGSGGSVGSAPRGGLGEGLLSSPLTE